MAISEELIMPITNKLINFYHIRPMYKTKHYQTVTTLILTSLIKLNGEFFKFSLELKQRKHVLGRTFVRMPTIYSKLETHLTSSFF